MKEMGLQKTEKLATIPCIADGKGALGTNRPAWGWSKGYKDTETNYKNFIKNNPEVVSNKPTNEQVIESFKMKTCQQFHEKVTNETLKISAMKKLNCSSVDYINYDPLTDPIQQNKTALIPTNALPANSKSSLDSVKSKFMQSMGGLSNSRGKFPKI
jgi:hypothetical protein